MQVVLDMAHSELRSLVVKAARGAGLSWGLAEEAGWATEWLARRALPAAHWAAEWLAGILDGRPDPVALGASIADGQAFSVGPLVPQSLPADLATPAYLLPFLHRIAERRGAVEIADPRGRVVLVGPDGAVTFGPFWQDRPALWTLQSATDPANGARVQVPAALVDCLDHLALRTTVPPSAASRRDAGARSSDND